MTFYQEINAAISSAKELAVTWGLANITKLNQGEQLGCCELQLVVLVQWIDVLEDYVTVSFDSDGNNQESIYECTTQAQIQKIIGKINGLVC